MVLAMVLAEAHRRRPRGAAGATAMMVVVAAGAAAVRVTCGPAPANAPDHLPHRSGERGDPTAVAADRFSTRWGGGLDRTEGFAVTVLMAWLIGCGRRCSRSLVLALCLSCQGAVANTSAVWCSGPGHACDRCTDPGIRLLIPAGGSG